MSFSLISKKFGVLLSKQMMNPAPTTIVVRRSLSASKNTINRHDLAVLIANEHEITVAQSDRIVKSVFDTIVDVSESILLMLCHFASAYPTQ